MTYKTAYRWFKVGQLRGYQMDTGIIIITEETAQQPERVAVYARVSSSENRDNLGARARRLVHDTDCGGP